MDKLSNLARRYYNSGWQNNILRALFIAIFTITQRESEYLLNAQPEQELIENTINFHTKQTKSLTWMYEIVIF